MAPHSSTLAWKIPWMEEPGGLQSMGSHRVGLKVSHCRLPGLQPTDDVPSKWFSSRKFLQQTRVQVLSISSSSPGNQRKSVKNAVEETILYIVTLLRKPAEISLSSLPWKEYSLHEGIFASDLQDSLKHRELQIEQGSANVFAKGPVPDYLGLHRPGSLCCSHRQYVNKLDTAMFQ